MPACHTHTSRSLKCQPAEQTKNDPHFVRVMPEHTPNFLTEDAMQERADEMNRRKETTLELVETYAGIKHAHRPRPLGEVAMVGVVERRPHEVAHLRNLMLTSIVAPPQGDLTATGNKNVSSLYQNGLVAGENPRREQCRRYPPRAQRSASKRGDVRRERRRHS
jgi:hypothetical protein